VPHLTIIAISPSGKEGGRGVEAWKRDGKDIEVKSVTNMEDVGGRMWKRS
jgi:hypothetical protein